MDETVGEAAFAEIHTVTTERIGEPSTCLLNENHGQSQALVFSAARPKLGSLPGQHGLYRAAPPFHRRPRC
jgi:hypothetical protein